MDDVSEDLPYIAVNAILKESLPWNLDRLHKNIQSVLDYFASF